MSFEDDLIDTLRSVGFTVVPIPVDTEAVACVAACDHSEFADDEDWWNQCIDMCMEKGGPLADLAKQIAKEVNG